MKLTDEVNYFYYKMALYELQMMNGKDLYDGLSYNTLLYINVISQMSACTVSKIADALHITRSAVTLKVGEMVRQGLLVKKQSSDDKRIHYLTLSTSLSDTLGIYDQVFGAIEAKLSRKYTAEQIALFNEILHTISGYRWSELKNG